MNNKTNSFQQRCCSLQCKFSDDGGGHTETCQNIYRLWENFRILCMSLAIFRQVDPSAYCVGNVRILCSITGYHDDVWKDAFRRKFLNFCAEDHMRSM